MTKCARGLASGALALSPPLIVTPSPTNRPIPAPNARTTQITAHHPNPKNHSSDTAPSPHPTLAPHKSQPITQIPKITVQTPPHPRTQRSHHTNHSPSPKSQKSQFRHRPIPAPTTLAPHKSQPITQIPKITVQTPPHPHTQRSHHTNHSPSPKSHKSQFRHPPIPAPTIAPHKSQPITQIPKITAQTPPHPHTQRSHHTNHSPSPKSQKSQFRHRPIPALTPNARTTQITAHHPNPINHSSDTAPSPHPTLAPHKSQPITQIP